MKAEMVATITDGKGRGKAARWGRNTPLSLDGKPEWRREGAPRGEGRPAVLGMERERNRLEEGGANGWVLPISGR